MHARVRRHGTWTCAVVALLVAAAAGCAESKRTVRFGVTDIELIGPNFLPRWSSLQSGLQGRLHRNVQFEPYTPHQIRAHLATGIRVSFAIVDAPAYAEIARNQEDIDLLATAVNTSGDTSRVGLIITRADSPIQTVADLKGKRFDFGPAGDKVLDTMAKTALAEAGVSMSDVLTSPLLGPYRHINSYEVAKAVVYEKVPGGIVDEAAYRTWSKTGGTILLGTVSQDQLRIVHRTEPVPEMVLLASKNADPELAAEVRDYFLKDLNTNPFKRLTELGPMNVRGFRAPEPAAYAAYCRTYDAVFPAPPEFDDERTTTQPSPESTTQP